MRPVRHWLDALSLPAAVGGAPEYAMPSASLLGGDLPPGHLHVWSGPAGAGKTALLLGLLHDAARRGRVAVLATYDLPAASLALRLLAMASGVPLHELEVAVGPGRVPSEHAMAAARARTRLASLPLYILEARGMSVASIEDRLVRSPLRPEVLGVDFLEAVVRPEGRPIESALAELASLASRRFVAVVCSARAAGAMSADRVGRIAPTEALTVTDAATATDAATVAEAAASTPHPAGRGCVDATLLSNRHGRSISCRMRVDGPAARLVSSDDATPT